MDRDDRKVVREERKLVREKIKLAREERRQTEKEHEKELTGVWGGLHAALWMFGLAIIAWQGWWWPGILVLVGLSVLLEGILTQFVPQAYKEEKTDAAPAVFSSSSASAAGASSAERHAELLPTNCPRCGGPTRGHEVHWTGPMSADCPYCGANLPMQKP